MKRYFLKVFGERKMLFMNKGKLEGIRFFISCVGC